MHTNFLRAALVIFVATQLMGTVGAEALFVRHISTVPRARDWQPRSYGIMSKKEKEKQQVAIRDYQQRLYLGTNILGSIPMGSVGLHKVSLDRMLIYPQPKGVSWRKSESEELDMQLLAANMDRTRTYMGSLAFKGFLQTPTDDQLVIEKRQEVIGALLQDDTLFENLSNALEALYQNEASMGWYWAGSHDYLQKAAASYYWKLLGKKGNNKCNGSTLGLAAGISLSLLWPIQKLCFDASIGVFLSELARCALGLGGVIDIEHVLLNGPLNIIKRHIFFKTWYFDDYDDATYKCNGACGPQCSGRPEVCHINQLAKIRNGGTWWSNYKADCRGVATQGDSGIRSVILQKALQGVGLFPTWDGILPLTKTPKTELKDVLEWNQVTTGTKLKVGAALAAQVAIQDAFFLSGWQQNYEALKNINDVLYELKQRSIGVSAFFAQVKKIAALVKQSDLAAVYQDKMACFEMVTATASAELKELAELLKDPLFGAKEKDKGLGLSLWARGKVLKVHRLMRQVYKELMPTMHALAELDALLGMVAFMRESALHGRPWSKVEWLAADKPSVELIDCWTPSIEAKKSVTNDFMLGGSVPGKMIITGPNGAGKSVAMKTLAHAACLAHEFGVAPAAESRMTPLSAIRTCMRPEESQEDQLSGFFSQAMAMEELAHNIEEYTGAHKKMLVIVDESFNKTEPSETVERTYQFCIRFAQADSMLMAMAAHVPAVTRLTDQAVGQFANYQIEIKDVGSDQFKLTHKLLPGHASWWFEDAPKRRRFIDWQLQEKKKSMGIGFGSTGLRG